MRNPPAEELLVISSREALFVIQYFHRLIPPGYMDWRYVQGIPPSPDQIVPVMVVVTDAPSLKKLTAAIRRGNPICTAVFYTTNGELVLSPYRPKKQVNTASRSQ